MKQRKCDENSPTFPYCLPSHDDVDVYPVTEFWHNNKPYLGTGCSSGPDGDFTYIYDVNERKAITIKNTREEHSVYKVKINDTLVKVDGEWGEEYLKTLPKYNFISKQKAKDHGCLFQLPIYLVFSYNEEWGLFRVRPSQFRSIYLPELQPVKWMNFEEYQLYRKTYG